MINEVFIKLYIQAYSCFARGGAVITIHHFYTLFIVVCYQSSKNNFASKLKVFLCEKVIEKRSLALSIAAYLISHKQGRML